MKSILLVKKLLGLVEMMSGPVSASLSLPEWQAVKMIFFTPCILFTTRNNGLDCYFVLDIHPYMRQLFIVLVVTAFFKPFPLAPTANLGKKEKAYCI